jgi:hypothetical protein
MPPFSDDLLIKPDAAIKAVRVTDMYGHCKCVKLMRDGKEIADSYWSMGEGVWYLSACGLETTLQADLASKSFEENLRAVEAGLRALVASADALRSARAA